MTRTRVLLVMCAGLAAPAWADLPPAAERLPAGVSMFVATPHLGELRSGLDWLESTIGNDAMFDEQTDFFGLAGLNLSGSAAMGAIFPEGAGPGDEPHTVAIVPVKDYAAFIGALGGHAGDGVATVEIDGEPAFARQLDGGYALFGDDEATVRAYTGGAGAAFAALAGSQGVSAAGSADLVFVADMVTLQPMISDGMGQARAGMNQGMMGAGANAAAGIFDLTETAMSEARSAVMALDFGDAGIAFDSVLTFQDGTETAKLMTEKGKSAGLLAKLPAQPFLFAAAFDASVPMVKRAVDGMMRMATDMGQDAGQMAELMKSAEGGAMVLGQMPTLMGGMFLNTVYYVTSHDPKALAEGMKQAYTGMNGQESNGITIESAYTSGSATVGGVKVDEWSYKMKPDPSNPMGQQMAMMNSMLFGPAGAAAGYVAPAGDGLVITMTKNSKLMEQALQTAQGKGAAFGADERFKAVAARLPADRVFEMYLGVAEMLTTGLDAAAMMGGAPPIDVPEKLSPIGIGATAHGGAVRMAAFVPKDVLDTIKDITAAMNQGDQGFDAPPEGDSSRF